MFLSLPQTCFCCRRAQLTDSPARILQAHLLVHQHFSAPSSVFVRLAARRVPADARFSWSSVAHVADRQGRWSHRGRNSVSASRGNPSPAPSRFVVPSVGCRDGDLAVSLCPVGQFIILERFSKDLLRKDSVL